MTTITVDGLNEETFRRVIEGRLRQGKPTEAVEKLRALLAPYVGPERILPERFLTVQSSDLQLSGWEGLEAALARHDQPGWPITALSIAFGWPGEEVPRPDSEGLLKPLIEIGYFTDRAFPFSQSAREDLLDGYSYHGCTWADESEGTDHCLSLDGIDDLHGALAALEAHLLGSEEPDEELIRAGSIGACLLSALLFQAVGERIESDGLPRPLCVLAGSNGVYPYFDAPVAGIPAHVLKAAEAAEEDELPLGQGVPGPRYSSLLVTGIPRARKRAVLVLDETAEETALRNANLRGLTQRDEPAAAPPEAAPEPLAQPLSDGGIIPIANGPLMAKKPAKQSWDFRELLGPRDELPELPHPTPERPLPVASNDLAEPAPVEQPEGLREEAPELPPAATPVLPELSRPDPVELSAPVPAAPEPGFSLLETNIQQRLQALVTPPAPEVTEPGHAPEVQAEPEELRSDVAPSFSPEGPVWPFGIGWLEDAEAAVAEAPVAAPQPGLWARLRRWLLPRR